MWESQAILRYLAATYGGTAWWPDAPARRAEVDQWMDWAQTALQPAFLNGIFWGYYRTPAPQRDERAIQACVEQCARYFEHIEQLLTPDRTFLLGDAMSLADIVIGTHLFRYVNLDIERPELPRVSAWYDRLTRRPAYARHVMVPFDDLFGRCL